MEKKPVIHALVVRKEGIVALCNRTRVANNRVTKLSEGDAVVMNYVVPQENLLHPVNCGRCLLFLNKEKVAEYMGRAGAKRKENLKKKAATSTKAEVVSALVAGHTAAKSTDMPTTLGLLATLTKELRELVMELRAFLR